MSRTPTIDAATVVRCYARAKVLLPNIQPLTRDPFTKAWFVGNMQIGRTGREAERYLAGVVDGMRYSAMTIGIANGKKRSVA